MLTWVGDLLAQTKGREILVLATDLKDDIGPPTENGNVSGSAHVVTPFRESCKVDSSRPLAIDVSCSPQATTGPLTGWHPLFAPLALSWIERSPRAHPTTDTQMSPLPPRFASLAWEDSNGCGTACANH